MNATHQPQTTRTTSTEHELIDLHAQACNSLSAALHLLTSTTSTDPANFGRALARAMRATTSLKRCCTLTKGVAQ
jgi:hypothetical protein